MSARILIINDVFVKTTILWLFVAFCGFLWLFVAFCGVLWLFACFCVLVITPKEINFSFFVNWDEPYICLRFSGLLYFSLIFIHYPINLRVNDANAPLVIRGNRGV